MPNDKQLSKMSFKKIIFLIVSISAVAVVTQIIQDKLNN